LTKYASGRTRVLSRAGESGKLVGTLFLKQYLKLVDG
jgi:hypothetical protein